MLSTNILIPDQPQIQPRQGDSTTLDQGNSTTLSQGNSPVDDVSSTEEPVIIEPRENIGVQPTFDDDSVRVIEIDDISDREKSSKFIRDFDETFDRQQNYKQVNCNGPKLSLAGTSADNFLVVQSPYFPGTYPLFLW